MWAYFAFYYGDFMALPQEEWLSLAKMCALGSTRRARHNHEQGTTLQVGNETDRYWAYCHRCKVGGVSMKSHVVLGVSAPVKSAELSLPLDRVLVYQAEPHVQLGVAKFLASKNMDLLYLPKEHTYFSQERKRLLIATTGEYMGRDTTGASPQKWLTYNAQHYVELLPPFAEVDGRAVIVEDTFSAYKLRHALVDSGVTVFCSLGTRIHEELFLTLLKRYSRVFSYYDGDGAGLSGAITNQRRLSAVGLAVKLPCAYQIAPTKLDPKDQTIEAMRSHVGHVFKHGGTIG